MKAYGQITLTYVSDGKPGAQGQAALNVSVANESQNIPCTNDGLTLENFLINIPFVGYEGFEKTDCTATVGLLPNGITLGQNTPCTKTEDGLIILNVAKDSDLGGVSSGSITITFSLKERKMKKHFTWTKTKDGGLSIIYTIEPSSYVLSKTYADNFSPKTITFKSFSKEYNSERVPYEGLFVIEESLNDVTYETKYTSLKNESQCTYTPSSTDITSIRCSLCEADKISNTLDRQSISVLKDIDDLKPEITEIKKTISGVDLKVDAVDKSIKGKVWQTDITTQINNYDGTSVKEIRDQVAKQEIKLGEIKTEVSDVKSTFSEGMHTLEERVSKAEQTTEGFRQEVSKTYATKKEVEDAVKNIKQLQISLSNDSYDIIVNSDGTSDYSGCTTTLSLLYGTLDVTKDATINAIPSEGVIGRWDDATHTYKVTKLSTDSGYVEFVATYNQMTTSKRFHLRKKIREQADYVFYELSCSSYIIQKTSDKKFYPETITFRAVSKDQTASLKPFNGYFKIFETENNTTYIEKYSSAREENQVIYTPTNSNAKSILCKLFLDSEFQNEVDNQSIVITSNVDIGVRNLIRNSKTMIYEGYGLMTIETTYITDENGNRLTDESGNRFIY